MTIHSCPMVRRLFRACRNGLHVVMLSLGFAIVSAGCNKATNDTPPTNQAAAVSGGGFTLSVEGFTLTCSKDWIQAPAIPGNPAVAAMFGTTLQEALDSGAKIVVMAPPIPTHSTADQLMEVLRKQASEQNSQFSKTEQARDVQIAGKSGFFQLVRSFGNANATTEVLREDTLQYKWTFASGNQILLIMGQCHASKAAEFAPKFEEIVQTLKTP